MSPSRSLIGGLLALISPWQYVAACILAVFLNPSTFLLVGMMVVVVYHGVLVQAGFMEVTATPGRTSAGDGHVLLSIYRRAAPVLATAGLVLAALEVPSTGGLMAGLLVAVGTALILAVLTISHAGTGV